MPADQDELEHRHADQDAATAVADMPLRGEMLIRSTEVFGIGCAPVVAVPQMCHSF